MKSLLSKIHNFIKISVLIERFFYSYRKNRIEHDKPIDRTKNPNEKSAA